MMPTMSIDKMEEVGTVYSDDGEGIQWEIAKALRDRPGKVRAWSNTEHYVAEIWYEDGLYFMRSWVHQASFPIESDADLRVLLDLEEEE